MAIYLCGDTHGMQDIEKVKEYFDESSFSDECIKEDSYLIVLGDCGVLWDDGEEDRQVKEVFNNLPVTVLWLDGNHENYDPIDEYPVEKWHGGKVQMINENIIHLMRGQVYVIDGLKFFAFGGGNSIDKVWRTENVSWWPDEMPNEREYEEGMENLADVDFQVDYILSHTCPLEIAHEICFEIAEGEETLQQYLQSVAECTEFVDWYFGHWHKDEDVDNFHCLYDEIVRLD